MSSGPPLPLLMPVTRRLWRTLRLTSLEFMGDRCFDKSAGLAYVSLLGVFAVLTVVLSVSSYVFQGDQAEIEQRINQFAYKLLPVEVHSTTAPPLFLDEALTAYPPPSEEGLQTFTEQQGALQEAWADHTAAIEARDDIRTQIVRQFDGLVTQIDGFRQNALGVGALGIIGLIAVSMMLFTQIEKGFNEVFHVRRRRPLWTAMTTYFSVLVLGPICIGLSVALSLRLGAHVEWLSPGMSALIVTCLMFSLAYWLIPNTRVSVVNALIGGIMAGLLWEAAKRGFILYIINVPSMRSFVLTLGVIPTFLIWLYTTWLVLFFGLELCYVLQHYSPLAGRVFKPSPALELNPRHLLTVLYEMASRFNQGRPQTSVTDLMKVTHLDEFNVHSLLDDCEERGWVTASEKHSTYVLARPPENIMLREVLINSVTGALSEPIAMNPTHLESFWHRWHGRAEASLPVHTLRDLVNGLTAEESTSERSTNAT